MLYLDRDMFTPQVRLGCDLKMLFLACAPIDGCPPPQKADSQMLNT